MKDLHTLFEMFRHLLVILSRKQRLRMIGMMLVIFIGSLFELLGVSAILPFIQALLEPEGLIKKPYIRVAMNLLGINNSDYVMPLVIVGIILIYLAKNVYLSISAYLQIAYSYDTQRELAVQTLRSFMKRPYSFFVENGSGVILRGVTDDISGVYKVIYNIFKLASEGFVIIVIAAYLFVIDSFIATGVLVVGILCMLVIIFGVKRKLTKLSILHRKAVARVNKWVSQVNSGIKDIMVYDRRELFVERYDSAYRESNVAIIRSDFADTIPERIIEFFCIMGIFVMILIRFRSGVNPQDFVPRMAVFAMGAFRLLPSISRVTGYIALLIFNRTKLEATYENIISVKSDESDDGTGDVKYWDEGKNLFENSIELKGVTWRYPSGTRNVLDKLSLTVKKGEAIGIIGESGTGKSTMADIILRLYKPQEGTILVDGVDVNTIPKAWTKMLAYVPQNVFLMDDTIVQNIVFGESVVDEKEVWIALEKASLATFVRNLPEGLNAIVGERGVKFSGGQVQRIAIARALYTKPQILILDEATSALDNETEEAVMEAIDALSGSMTLIIIAHRISTLKNCDRIYEIVDGKAIERDKRKVLEVY